MIQGATWSAVFKDEKPIFLPTQEWFEFKARHGGNRNDLVLAKICLIMRSRGYRFNGTRRRCTE